MKHLILASFLIAFQACTPTYSGYGVDIKSPDAQAWIAGIVAVQQINDSFDQSLHP